MILVLWDELLLTKSGSNLKPFLFLYMYVGAHCVGILQAIDGKLSSLFLFHTAHVSIRKDGSRPDFYAENICLEYYYT